MSKRLLLPEDAAVGVDESRPPPLQVAPPYQEQRSKPKSAFSSPLRGNGRGAEVSAGQSLCEGLGRVPRLSPVDGAHVPEQKSLRTHLYNNSSDQINLLRPAALAALARGTGRVRMHGGRG